MGGMFPVEASIGLKRIMIRKAFVMSVYPGKDEEYRRRHSPIWTELEEVLKAHGVHNYSIFINRETLQLFAYVEIEDEDRWNAIAETDVCRRWWRSNATIMPSNAIDASPVSLGLDELFHLD